MCFNRASFENGILQESFDLCNAPEGSAFGSAPAPTRDWWRKKEAIIPA